MEVAWEVKKNGGTILYYYQLRCYVERIIKTILIYKTLLYAKVVDFEILGNFCVDYFFIWRHFGVQIVGTIGCM